MDRRHLYLFAIPHVLAVATALIADQPALLLAALVFSAAGKALIDERTQRTTWSLRAARIAAVAFVSFLLVVAYWARGGHNDFLAWSWGEALLCYSWALVMGFGVQTTMALIHQDPNAIAAEHDRLMSGSMESELLHMFLDSIPVRVLFA